MLLAVLLCKAIAAHDTKMWLVADGHGIGMQTLSSLLCGFAAAGGRASGCQQTAALLRCVVVELTRRLDEGPVPHPHALLPDAKLPAVAWAVAISHASDENLRWFDRPCLESLQVG